MRLSLAMTLPEDAAHLSMLRRVVREVLGASSQVNIQDVDDIEVLVGELATNALRHAHSTDGIRVEVSLDGDLASVIVTDTGVGFARAAVPPPGTARNGNGSGSHDGNGGEERWGGWGLPLVDSIAERVEFGPNEPHGTRVRAFKRLNG